MRDLIPVPFIYDARREAALDVGLHGHARLVVRDPIHDPVAEPVRHCRGVFSEQDSDLAVRPAAEFFL